MTKGLAKEMGPHGVRVTIAPGFVITEATRNRPVEWQQSFLKARALSREQKRLRSSEGKAYFFSEKSPRTSPPIIRFQSANF